MSCQSLIPSSLVTLPSSHFLPRRLIRQTYLCVTSDGEDEGKLRSKEGGRLANALKAKEVKRWVRGGKRDDRKVGWEGGKMGLFGKSKSERHTRVAAPARGRGAAGRTVHLVGWSGFGEQAHTQGKRRAGRQADGQQCTHSHTHMRTTAPQHITQRHDEAPRLGGQSRTEASKQCPRPTHPLQPLRLYGNARPDSQNSGGGGSRGGQAGLDFYHPPTSLNRSEPL
jgi:hypothetical protein